ncbi:hypothetical protein PILCRDRAFT_207924 [Piloderma croceum F 1598]|uniref:Uncharacterized protein n=1 Tax=Piloderma croceum (strain F 1598) TaxID=765440 RepID=A0A0C3GEE6_PILCF|nr:hypothetical protein PILCRDRAFT_207924 [Piloderma croceum F 1598]
MEGYPKDWAHTAHCLTPLSVISLCLRLSIQPPHAIQMPTFSSSSVVRTADPSLLLEVTHFLVQNSPSETAHVVRGNIPENVNVILASDLVITLSGTLDRMKIRSIDIAISAVALHFKQYLETNAGQLGLNTISNIYIDETDGLPKLTVTSARTVPQGMRPPHATLVSIDIVYKWRSRPRNISTAEEIDQLDHTNPFLSQLFLPFQTTLNTVIEKFVSVHLVKRYPFIFGPWCNVTPSTSLADRHY